MIPPGILVVQLPKRGTYEKRLAPSPKRQPRYKQKWNSKLECTDFLKTLSANSRVQLLYYRHKYLSDFTARQYFTSVRCQCCSLVLYFSTLSILFASILLQYAVNIVRQYFTSVRCQYCSLVLYFSTLSILFASTLLQYAANTVR